MSNPKKPTIGQKSRYSAIQPHTLVFAIILFALLGLASFYGAWELTSGKFGAARRELLHRQSQELLDNYKAQKAEQDAVVASATAEDKDLLTEISQTTNSLINSCLALGRIESEVASLETNSYGVMIAAQPDLLGSAMEAFNTVQGASPNFPVFVDKIENAKREQIDLQDAVGSTVFPDQALKNALGDELQWAKDRENDLSQLELSINTIVRDARSRFSFTQQSANPPTLEQAIQARQAAEAQIPTFTLAPPSANALNAPGKDYQWMAEIIGDSSMSLHDKALDPRVQAALAPFLTPGIYFPGRGGTIYEPVWVAFGSKQPMSFSLLKNLGALNDDEQGLLEFVSIATDPRDNRPRFGQAFSQMNWNDDINLRTEAALLQTLVKLLGPTYVNQSMMLP